MKPNATYRKATIRATEAMWIAGRIADRLHVSASNREVIKAVRKALKKPYRHSQLWRKARKALYRAAIKRHAANGGLYAYVMRGGH